MKKVAKETLIVDENIVVNFKTSFSEDIVSIQGGIGHKKFDFIRYVFSTSIDSKENLNNFLVKFSRTIVKSRLLYGICYN